MLGHQKTKESVPLNKQVSAVYSFPWDSLCLWEDFNRRGSLEFSEIEESFLFIFNEKNRLSQNKQKFTQLLFLGYF